MDLFELARLKRERNLVRKTRALANKGIDYVPRFDGDALTDAKDAEKREEPVAQLPVPETAGESGAVAAQEPTAPATEGDCRISVVMRGERHSVTFNIPGIAGSVRGSDDLRRLMLAALQTQFGKRIANVNDLS